MGFVIDLITGDKMILAGDVSDLNGGTTPDTPGTDFIVEEYSESINAGLTPGTLFAFTTGTDDLTCKIASPSSGTTYRILKIDDTTGTVTITDHDDVEIIVLKYQWEHIDIKYTSSTEYLIM